MNMKFFMRGLRIASFLAFLFTLQIMVGYIFIREFSLFQARQSLNQLSTRIQNDLQYKNGKWDTRLYASDPYTPHPTGSSGFVNPLYIITTDGFVIERNQPINGLLDAADFKHLLTFTTPQTIETTTNEQWRIVSVPIKNGDTTIGVIAVSYYNPVPEAMDVIDTKLLSSIDVLRNRVSIINGSIDTSRVDGRGVPYDISFEIVDNFNKVLANNGRISSFIDPSYVESELKNNQKVRTTKDQYTNETYLIQSNTVYQSGTHTPIALIIVGESINPLFTMLSNYLLFSFIAAIFILIPLTLITLYILKKDIFSFLSHHSRSTDKPIVHLSFNKRESIVNLDDRIIEIPYASNQYYLVDAVFSHPHKRFEQDELLERFGEPIEQENARKVYDAMLAVNKKVGFKIISYKDRTYRFSPEYIHLLH